MYPNYSAPSFWQEFSFELNSFFGRRFFYNTKSRFPLNQKPMLVDIGVGNNFTDGWIHVDFYHNLRKPWKKRRLPEVETDLRFPLNCPDNVVDGVYSGHTLEHLWPNHAYQLLSEIYRILKPGCWLHINVPDLKIAVDIYNGKIVNPLYKYKAEAIGNWTQNWGHHSVWDVELLTVALGMQGFKNIKELKFGETGTDKRLMKEEAVRKHETLVMEAMKP